MVTTCICSSQPQPRSRAAAGSKPADIRPCKLPPKKPPVPFRWQLESHMLARVPEVPLHAAPSGQGPALALLAKPASRRHIGKLTDSCHLLAPVGSTFSSPSDIWDFWLGDKTSSLHGSGEPQSLGLALPVLGSFSHSTLALGHSASGAIVAFPPPGRWMGTVPQASWLLSSYWEMGRVQAFSTLNLQISTQNIPPRTFLYRFVGL